MHFTLRGKCLKQTFQMAPKTIEEVKMAVEVAALKISAPANLLPSYSQPKFDCQPFIEFDRQHGFMYYVIKERDEELRRSVTDKISELLFWVFKDVTSEMAWQFELKNPVKGQDRRRVVFEKQAALLEMIDPAYRIKIEAEHNIILKFG